MEAEVDEIKEYLDARYVGPHEAVWRIFGFSMHDMYPYVEQLAVHLPGQHEIHFQEGVNREVVARAMEDGCNDSTLTAFFRLCNTDDNARSLLYSEVPTNYRWVRKQWQRRQRDPGEHIGRMIYASPRNPECFSLRLLLTRVRGPRSFEELRTYEGQVYPTFQAAARARGLLQTDEEWDLCLRKAASFTTNIRQLRFHFVYILINCSPSDPGALWLTHRDALSEDIRLALESRQETPQETPQEMRYLYAMGEIQGELQAAGASLSDFPSLPQEVAHISGRDRQRETQSERARAEDVASRGATHPA